MKTTKPFSREEKKGDIETWRAIKDKANMS
jgi:hypothetical protein